MLDEELPDVALAPAQAPEGAVTLALADWRINSFDAGVEGVEPITRAGTEVPAGDAETIRSLAERSGVRLETRGE